MTLPAGIRAAIIDLDGTLVDTLGDFEAAIYAMLDDLRLPPVTRAFIERTIGKGSEHLIRSMLAEVSADSHLFDQAYTRYQHHYLQINGQHAVVYEGVLEGLQQLKAHGIELACVTNKPQAFAEPLLERKGLRTYFEVVFGGDAFAHKKPHPEPLLKACATLGSAPPQTLMVGDSSNDALAARAAGCPVVLMSYGYNHGAPVLGLDVDGVFDRLDLLQLSG